MFTQTSPRTLARLTGLFFLLTIVGGIVAQAFISQRLVNFSDAAATANNILTNKGLFQLGFSIYLIEMACQVATATFLYQLLKPVNGTIALLAVLLELTGIAIKTVARVFYIAPLFVLGASPSGGSTAVSSVLGGFTTEQLQSIALVLLKVNDQGAAVALALFGFSTPLFGYLIYRSKFLPRWLGALGRLKEGIAMARAQEDLTRVAAILEQQYPANHSQRGVQLARNRVSRRHAPVR